MDQPMANTFRNVADDVDLDDFSDDSESDDYISRAGPGGGCEAMSVEDYDEQQDERAREYDQSTTTTSMSGSILHIGNIALDVILGERGRGAFGTVYEGKNVITGDIVAVKKIRVNNEQDVADVMTEIRNFEKIPRHSNLVYMLETHFTKPSYWLVMEYCDLGDLQQFFVKAVPNLPDQADLMLQSARGLNHMHTQKIVIVHRDIKPANIMLKADEHGRPEVKITDFGLAKIVNLETEMAKTALLETQAGTPGFMAPEFFARTLYTKSVDTFALGLVFLAMMKFKEGDKFLMPTIENALEVRAVGQEMHLAHVSHRPQPTLVSDSRSDNPMQLAIKQVIREMSCFDFTKRLKMVEVVKKLEALQPAKAAPVPTPRKAKRVDSTPEEKKGVGFGLLEEAARERPGAQGGSGEHRQLISLLEEQFSQLNTDYNPDEFKMNDIVCLDKDKNRVHQLQESLFGECTNRLDAYLGKRGKLVKKTSFYFAVLFEDNTEWKLHPALVKKWSATVAPRPDRGSAKSSRGLKRYLRGDVVSLPEGFNLTSGTDSKFLEQRAMVSGFDREQNSVTLEFATGVQYDVQADVVKIADMSGHIIDDGDMVIVSANKDQLRKLQRGAGGFQAGMENLLGKAGIVENLYDNDTARVQFKREKKAWTLNIQALKLLFKAEDLMRMVVRY